MKITLEFETADELDILLDRLNTNPVLTFEGTQAHNEPRAPEPTVQSAPTVPSAEEYAGVEDTVASPMPDTRCSPEVEDIADQVLSETEDEGENLPPHPKAQAAIDADATTEKDVKPVRKPRGRTRPARAKVFEAPGECLDCDLVSATMVGWYCKPKMTALPVDAKRCKDFVEGVPDGEAEPDPPPAPVDPEEPTQEPPQPPEPREDVEAPIPPEPETQTPLEPEKDPQEPPVPLQPLETTDPEEFIKQQGELPKDPEELRNLIRTEARLCIQNPDLKGKFTETLKSFAPKGQITAIPEDKLPECAAALKAIRAPGDDSQGEIAF